MEIGGIDFKFILQNPPKAFLEEDIKKHVSFLLREAKTLPRVGFDLAEAKKLADGLYQVTALVGNRGFMPTYVFREAMKNPRLDEIEVSLLGASEIIEGKETTKIGQLEGYGSCGHMSWNFPATTVEEKPLKKKLTWVIRAEAGSTVTLTASSSRIGRCSAEITL